MLHRLTFSARTLRALAVAVALGLSAPGSALAVCGDTVVDVGEECDDGNVSGGDCCSASCSYEPSTAPCADDGEVCTADVCDGAGTCTHVAGNAGAVCRAAAGECDVAETCSAGSADCPADALAPSGTPCGNPIATSCSAPDTCDDLGVCDEKNLLPGTPCEDDFPCTFGDTCSPGGVCHAGLFPACDDGIPCTANACEPETGECTFEVRPADGCKDAGKSALSVTTRGDGKAKWKWSRGEETTCDELGSPDTATDYDVCIFDGAGAGTYELAAHFAVPASGLWQRSSSCRWTYKDRAGLADGITAIKLTPRAAGRASIQFSAEGEGAPLPVPVAADRFLTSDPNVTVQVVNSNGVCWESRLTEARKNSGDSFKGTGAE